MCIRDRAKPDQNGNESTTAYQARLNKELRDLKRNVKDGMKDGMVTGFIDDHEFTMNSTTKDMGNVDKAWSIDVYKRQILLHFIMIL